MKDKIKEIKTLQQDLKLARLKNENHYEQEIWEMEDRLKKDFGEKIKEVIEYYENDVEVRIADNPYMWCEKDDETGKIILRCLRKRDINYSDLIGVTKDLDIVYYPTKYRSFLIRDKYALLKTFIVYFDTHYKNLQGEIERCISDLRLAINETLQECEEE